MALHNATRTPNQAAIVVSISTQSGSFFDHLIVDLKTPSLQSWCEEEVSWKIRWLHSSHWSHQMACGNILQISHLHPFKALVLIHLVQDVSMSILIEESNPIRFNHHSLMEEHPKNSCHSLLLHISKQNIYSPNENHDALRSSLSRSRRTKATMQEIESFLEHVNSKQNLCT